MHEGDLMDFGPQASEGILTFLPPHRVGSPYPALVPKTDADGNTLAGVRLPRHRGSSRDIHRLEPA